MIDRLVDAPVTLHVLLLVVACARFTILLLVDRITRPWRLAVYRRWAPGTWLGYLVRCPWCVSVYVATLLVMAWSWWPAPALVVALSATVAVLAPIVVETLFPDHDDERPDPIA